MKSMHGAENFSMKRLSILTWMPMDTLLIARSPVDVGQHMLQKMGYVCARFNDRE